MTGTHRKISGGEGRVAGNGFFVVGGPVQPDRPCYVLRKADERLFRHLRENDFCYVLGPKQQGKSSLLVSVGRRLSDRGELISVVDLTQVLSREAEGTDPGRWFYGIAYRIVRDLRLKFDLQSWWQSRGGLSTQHRLVEFFWEVVLANTTAPITIFFDEIENTLGLPFAQDFYSGLRSCFNSRAAEPDFNRLRFVFVGVAAPERLCRDPMLGPFVIARNVELNDFSMAEACGLLPGLELEANQAARAMERILYWTGGQPYLTQKLCRALARRGAGDKAADTVDEIVQAQFLSKNRSHEEPNLSAVRRRLSGGRRHIVAALALFGSLRKGKRIVFDAQSLAHQELVLSGLLRVDETRALQIRNRIYDQVFSKTWVNQSLPFDWKGVATAAGVVFLLLLVPFWYTQVLPRPYIETLSAVTEDYQLALSAYNDLRSIPGYGGTADRLFSSVLRRRSLRATSLAQALEADLGLRSLPDNSVTADQLMAAFWDRQALGAENAEQRDAALLYKISSLTDDTPHRRRRIAELIDHDYPLLASTIRPFGDLQNVAISDDGESLATLTRDGALRIWDSTTGDSMHAAGTVLTADEFVALEREILVNLSGAIGQLNLVITLSHSNAARLSMTLVSPQGTRVALDPSLAAVEQNRLVFDSRSAPALARLRGQTIRGGWQLKIEDHQEQDRGSLIAWELLFGGHANAPQRDSLAVPLPLPPPRSTDRTRVVLGKHGRLAAAYGENTALGGFVSVWDIGARRLLSQPMKSPGLMPFEFALEEKVLLAIDEDASRVVAWNTDDGSTRFVLDAAGQFDASPILDQSGQILLLRDGATRQQSSVRVVEIESGSELARLPFAATPLTLAVDGEGRWLASTTGDRAVEVWDLHADELVDEYLLNFPVTQLKFDPRGLWLAAFGADGEANVRPAPGSNGRSLSLVLAQPAALVFDPRSDAALVYQDGAWRMISLPQGQSLSPALRHPAPNGALAEIHATDLIMTGSADGFLRLWDKPKPGEQRGSGSLYGTGRRLVSAAVSDSGKLVAVGLGNGSIRLWQETDGDSISSLIQPSDAFLIATTALAFNHKGTLLAIADESGSIRLLDLMTGTQHTLGRQSTGATHLAFSPDDRRLAAAGSLGTRLWFPDEPGRDAVHLGSDDPVAQLAFSPDSKLIAVSPAQGELSVWHTSSGDSAGSIRPHGQVSSAAFSPDGQLLVTGSNDGALQFWNLETGATAWPEVRLGSRLVDIFFSNDGQGLWALSAGWMHYLALPESGPRATHSRLLPEPLPPGGFFLPEDSALRLDYIDWLEGSDLQIRSLSFDDPAGRAWPGAVADMERYWKGVLHLEIGEDGLVRPGHSVFDVASGLDDTDHD